MIRCLNKTEEKEGVKKILVTRDTTPEEFEKSLRAAHIFGYDYNFASLYKKLRKGESVALVDGKYVIEFADEGTNVDYRTSEMSDFYETMGVMTKKKSIFNHKEIEEGDSIDGHPVLKRGKQGEPDSVLVTTEKEGEKKTAKYVPIDPKDRLEYDAGVLVHKQQQTELNTTSREVSDTAYVYNEEGRQPIVSKRTVTDKEEERIIPEKKVRRLSYKVKPKDTERD